MRAATASPPHAVTDGCAPSDADLVDRARRGDETAYATIYLRHQRRVTLVVRSRLGRQGDPADAVQDTFTAAWRSLHALRDPEKLGPWLAQIARRTAIDHGRRHRRQPVADSDELLHDVPDPGPTAQDLLDLTALAGRLDAGIQSLAPRDARAIALAVHLGFGPDQIGAALGVTPGNAKVILHRARHRLRLAAAS
jgi:RNA polymerase sigma factor (sigma-70 family)